MSKVFAFVYFVFPSIKTDGTCILKFKIRTSSLRKRKAIVEKDDLKNVYIKTQKVNSQSLNFLSLYTKKCNFVFKSCFKENVEIKLYANCKKKKLYLFLFSAKNFMKI